LDVSDLRTETIRDKDDSFGERVMFAALLATARKTLHVEVNVGDLVRPEQELVTRPRLLAAGSITWRGIPWPWL